MVPGWYDLAHNKAVTQLTWTVDGRIWTVTWSTLRSRTVSISRSAGLR
jgi:hypothetical protein